MRAIGWITVCACTVAASLMLADALDLSRHWSVAMGWVASSAFRAIAGG